MGSLRNGLHRLIMGIRLPETNSIASNKWQSHNLRVSRLTNLYNGGMNTKKLMIISGHKSLDSLERYLKCDHHEVILELIENDKVNEKN